MFFTSQTFWLPKDLEYESEYQDAFDVDPLRGIAAIADGVSAGIFSGNWARILTNAILEGPPDIEDAESFHTWLADRRKQWADAIDVENLAWHQKPKMRTGAFSTLLWIGLTPEAKEGDNAEQSNRSEKNLPENNQSNLQDKDIDDDNPKTGSFRLKGVSIGDCCLFHVREGQTLSSFPMESADDFNQDPLSIGSSDLNRDHVLQFDIMEGSCRAGDLIVLCTDAIGAWALARQEAGEQLEWEGYWNISPEAWKEQILALRNEHQMRVDDSTLVLLRVAPDEDSAAELEMAREGPTESNSEPDESSKKGKEKPRGLVKFLESVGKAWADNFGGKK